MKETQTPERRGVGPLYQKVKDFILERIESGEWQPADRVLSENQLVSQLGVSRMTANRALRELSDEGILERVPGVGTFVAEARTEGHPLQVLNIADEVRTRGHRHRARLLFLGEENASPETALGLQLKSGASVYHSVILHFEEDAPIQLEDRHVNPAVAPDYPRVDFEATTPSEYLIQVAPLMKVEHVVRAVAPGARETEHLNLAPGEPCLLLLRRSWSKGIVASTARLYYPGSRYQLGGS